jgi:hypothetical protein
MLMRAGLHRWEYLNSKKREMIGSRREEERGV